MAFWIITVVLAACTLIVLYTASRAPEGYQDEEGFHYGPEQDTHHFVYVDDGVDVTDDPREPR